MILPDFKVFNKDGRLLGVDWGARRTGIAISDESREFVFTREPIFTEDADGQVQQILELVESEKVVGIVIGLPLRMDGSESETTVAVRAFAERLSEKTDVPIMFIDETLSSATAQEQMGRVRRTEIKEKLDSNAARVILENAIAIIARVISC
ncbi:MAG: Holliday junction resolvase RuvX [Alphaproteobacteria bacterium]|nr:Holliday junction resolvase RuvX [Alphaproteobacteria bacterium]